MSEEKILETLDNLVREVSEVKFQLEVLSSQRPPAMMPIGEYAASCGIKSAAVKERFKKGYYNTPEGFDGSCFDYGGKRKGLRFIKPLADRYYNININHKNTQ